jgi:hypothetical protein
MTLEVTSGVKATEIDSDYAETYAEAYETLKGLPVNRQLNLDFETEKLARDFVRQGKAWAAAQIGPNGRTLVFARKGVVKANPKRVSFRVYEARPEK